MNSRYCVLVLVLVLVGVSLVLSGCSSEEAAEVSREMELEESSGDDGGDDSGDSEEGDFGGSSSPDLEHGLPVLFSDCSIKAEIDGDEKQFGVPAELLGYAGGLTYISASDKASGDIEGINIVFPGMPTGNIDIEDSSDIWIEYVTPDKRYKANQDYADLGGAEGKIRIVKYGDTIEGTFSAVLVNEANPLGADNIEIENGAFVVSKQMT